MSYLDLPTIVARMQDAVDVVLSGEHATSRVSACIFNPNAPAVPPLAVVSARPACLKLHFAWDARLGASSQFVHAEVSAIASFKGPLRGAHVCVTDPFCPNCAKAMAEAGVRTVYIDHKGFQKDFIARNASEFDAMSLPIARAAGMNVFTVNRKDMTLTPVLAQQGQPAGEPQGLEFFDIEGHVSLAQACKTLQARFGAHTAWAAAFVRQGTDTAPRGLLALEGYPPGLDAGICQSLATTGNGKYRFQTDPLTRLLIAARRHGVSLVDGWVACSSVPWSRSIVNALGFGVDRFVLASRADTHDMQGRDVLDLLSDVHVLQVRDAV